ncbi:cation diffusion facilitator family transporter [Patescibacteria group bacterium]
MKNSPKNKKISSERVVITSFFVNVSDIIVNAIVVYLSGSVVMLSQLLQGFADLTATGFLVYGVKRSKRKADKVHPLGYGREIYFWTFLSALVTLSITAGASFYFGLKRFLNPEPVENIGLAFIALSFALITNGYSMSLGLKRLLGGSSFSKIKEVVTKSVLIDTKKAFVLDLMGATASVLGLVALFLCAVSGNYQLDGLGAMAIGIAMGFMALFILKGAKDLLVGKSASSEIEKKIVKAAESFPKVNKVLKLQTLNIGTDKLLVNMEVHLVDKLTTDEIEKLIDKIESEIRRAVPSAAHIQIELETPDI